MGAVLVDGAAAVLHTCFDVRIGFQVAWTLVDLAVCPMEILLRFRDALVGASAGRFEVAKVVVHLAAPHTFALVSATVPRLLCMRSFGLH